MSIAGGGAGYHVVVDESRIVPRAVELSSAFRDAMAELVRVHGLTLEEMLRAGDVIEELNRSTGMPLAQCASLLFADVFLTSDGDCTTADIPGPIFLPGAPLIPNPGVLPMRPDEQGVPLIARGRVRTANGAALAGTEMNIFQAAPKEGWYSSLGRNDQPNWNLRGRLITDGAGRYEVRTVTPPPYPAIPGPLPASAEDAFAALGRTKYRPTHVHFVIRHPDLAEEGFATEVYFRGDPLIELDALGSGFAAPDLRAELIHHDDPQVVAATGFDRPFNVLTFDFVLRTKDDSANNPA